VTFLDAPKVFDDNKSDDDIVSNLLPFQPDPAIDTSTITSEAINGVTSLPRGACTGILIPSEGPNPSPSPPTTEPPIKDNFCQYNDEKIEFSNGALLTFKWRGGAKKDPWMDNWFRNSVRPLF
jgi:hypothetical protein